MSGLTIKRNTVAKSLKALHALLGQDVLVGVPAMRADRKESTDPVNNAEIGYWMEFGAPGANIPARPHLVPGIEQAQPEISVHFRKAAVAGLTGNEAEVTRQLHAAGLTAQSSVRGLINAGIAPALSDSTIAARARRGRKGAIQEQENRARGEEPSTTLAKPLIDTAQYRNSQTYVVRRK